MGWFRVRWCAVRDRCLRLSISAVRFHAAMAVVWGVLLAPTMLLLRNSIAWVVFMSWWANFVGELSAYQAARGERETVSNEQHEDVIRRLMKVERQNEAMRAEMRRMRKALTG